MRRACRQARPRQRGEFGRTRRRWFFLATESGGNERRNLLLDELLDLRRVEYLDERLQPRIILLVLPCSEAQHETIVDRAVDDERRFWIAAGRDQIGDVDERERDVIERAISLRRIEFDNLQVLGIFDDIELASYTRPSLTTVTQPVREMGELATRLLIGRVNGDSRSPQQYRLQTRLVIRESCGRNQASHRGDDLKTK